MCLDIIDIKMCNITGSYCKSDMIGQFGRVSKHLYGSTEEEGLQMDQIRPVREESIRVGAIYTSRLLAVL